MEFRMIGYLVGIGLLACTGTDKENIDLVDTDEEVEENTYCSDLGLTSIPFNPDGDGGDFGEIAPDFSFNTINHGEWMLSENWTGCDNYIFINYYEQNKYPVDFSNSNTIKEYLELAPPNTNLFVLALSNDSVVEIEEEMTDVWAMFVTAFSTMDEDTANWWRDHVHFVSDSAWSADWIGPLNNQYYSPDEFVLWSAAIDRRQRVRETGGYCDPSTGWEQCPPKFMAYESIYFNFEEDREQRLEAEAEAVTIVSVLSDEPVSDPGWAGARTIMEVELPAASTMESFDTLELDMTLNCSDYPAGMNCPAWDYIVNAYLCEVDDASTEEDESEVCNKELGRWITTYWRPGRWVHDATPMLAWLQDGGTRKIAFYSQQLYHVSLDLRFSNRDIGVRPIGMEEAFRGGGFGQFYNWGNNHEISETEWTQWIREEEIESFTRLSEAEVSANRTVIIGAGLQIIDGTSDMNRFSVISHDTEAQVLITSEGEFGDDYQRFDYLFDPAEPDRMALCLSEREAISAEEAELAVEHCLTDDPTSCSIRADRENLRTGCNFGAWTLLDNSENQDDIFGDWQETRSQQYWTTQNGSNNAEYRNKFSRWDWTIQDQTFYFCHTKADASSEEALEGFWESCAEDNSNTATADESLNCTLQTDARSLRHGCNGGAWRRLEEEGQTGEPSGQYTEVWHEDKLPIEFTPPAGTTKVEVAGVISGHGFGSDTLNCAEFCDHQHQFWVQDEQRHTKTHPEANVLMGCADQVAIGTIPNQSGTWVYGRGGWCPGMEVPVWRVDLTDDVDLSGSNSLSYISLVDGEIYHPNYTTGSFNPRIDMRSYVVYYQ